MTLGVLASLYFIWDVLTFSGTGNYIMHWDAIGAIAELPGALAVVVTLIYLSIQMRQNHQQDYHAFEGREQWMFTNPGVRERWQEYRLNYNDVEFQTYIDASLESFRDSAD